MKLSKLQKSIYNLKKERGYNLEDIYLEFCYLQEEASEAFNAFHKKKEGLDLELADVAIYLCGIAEILGIDLEEAILKKHHINSQRKYELQNGVHVRTKEGEVKISLEEIKQKYNLS